MIAGVDVAGPGASAVPPPVADPPPPSPTPVTGAGAASPAGFETPVALFSHPVAKTQEANKPKTANPDNKFLTMET